MQFELSREKLLLEKEQDFNFYRKLMKYEKKVKKPIIDKGQDVMPMVRQGSNFETCPDGGWEVVVTIQDEKGYERLRRVHCEWDSDLRCFKSTDPVYVDEVLQEPIDALEKIKHRQVGIQNRLERIEEAQSSYKIKDGVESESFKEIKDKYLEPVKPEGHTHWVQDGGRSAPFKEGDYTRLTTTSGGFLSCTELARGGIVPEGSFCPQQVADELWDKQQEWLKKCEDAEVITVLSKGDSPFERWKAGEISIVEYKRELAKECYTEEERRQHKIDIADRFRKIDVGAIDINKYTQFEKVFKTLGEGKDVKVIGSFQTKKDLQLALFDRGYKWQSGGTEVRHLHEYGYRVFSVTKRLSYISSKSQFDTEDTTEVVL